MQQLLTGMKNFALEEAGATGTEYAFLAVLIGVVIIVALGLLGANVNNLYQDAADKMAVAS